MAEMSGGSERTRAPRTAAVLRILASLAPDRRQPVYDVSGQGAAPMAWVGPLRSVVESGEPFRMNDGDLANRSTNDVTGFVAVKRSPELEALLRYDALTAGLPALRVGWVWIRGTVEIDGGQRRLLMPLLSRPVEISDYLVGLQLKAIGAWDLWPLVHNPTSAAALEAEAAFGGGALAGPVSDALLDRLPRLRRWIDQIVAASSLPPVDRLVNSTDPTRLRIHDGDGLVAVVGYGVYAEAGVDATHPSETLRTWSTDPAVAGSALASLYLGAPAGPADDEPVMSPLPLTDRQAEVVRAARTEAVVTVSGPPGTGKSQTAAAPDATLDAISAAVHLGVLRNLAGRAAGRSETDADARWVAMEQADLAHRMARGQALAETVAERPDAASRRAVAALATALRGGLAGRRSHLAQIDVGRLTEALPLWIGTLGEIETMLPPTAAAFDLVILDEASQIDQIAASAALLRARRVVVIGDPRQLRFVSFLADDAVRQAVAASDCQPLADRLDLRRVSAFDLGASAATVVFLDEHFRSLPHLIGFSARRFYDGRLLVATRHPANEGIDAIDVRRVEGTRSDGVNPAEVDAALATVHDLLADEERPRQTIGVISPYRAQVDAIRQRVGAEVPIEVLQSGRVRVDTVHGFQGAECDVAVASFGVSDGAGRGRPFLEDPHLFNVLVTRARRRLVVLASIDDPPPGLLADYLRWADAPMAPAEGGPAADEWTARLAEVLGDAGVAVRTGYPVGRWLVDLVVGSGTDAVAVATGVYRDGSAAHIRRHLCLDRLGWRQGEAFPTSHDGDPVATALALTGQDGSSWKR